MGSDMFYCCITCCNRMFNMKPEIVAIIVGTVFFVLCIFNILNAVVQKLTLLYETAIVTNAILNHINTNAMGIIDNTDKMDKNIAEIGAYLAALIDYNGIDMDKFKAKQLQNKLQSIPETVFTALKEGRSIEAIKIYRSHMGIGLKEAKDYIDSIKKHVIIKN
jgi:ribosomal protein L7/L12